MDIFMMNWRKYDPEATGFINLSDLDDFVKEFAKSEEGSKFFVLIKKVSNNCDMRARLVANLKIPTYFNQTKVMYYDVLITLCHRKTF